MTLQVLISTMNSDPRELIKKMNVNSDAIIINQCDKNGYEEFKYKENLIKVYHFNERGIGLSRNNALMRATADIVLFADDDEVLVDNYKDIIINEFETNKKADFIVFEIETIGKTDRKYKPIKKNKKINWSNCLRYGAIRFAVKLNRIRNKNISFSLMFGGGAMFGSGEDSIFIYDCIKSRFNIYQNMNKICTVDMSNSSWFSGYNKKFYMDKGALFRALYGQFSMLFIFLYVLRHRKEKTNLTFIQKMKSMLKGSIKYKNI